MSLHHVVDLLRCPHCAGPLSITGRTVGCPSGHRFDLARQGYLNLLASAQPANADTAEMISARDRFLAAGHYRPLADAVADRAAAAVGSVAAPVVAELGAGTGHHLARVLDRLPAAVGLATDVSVAAARRAARAHDRIGAVVADTWAGLPVADHRVDLLTVIFAPRNPAEFARLLRPGGRVIIAGPGPDHLAGLRDRLGLIGIEPDKQDRLLQAFDGHLRFLDHQRVRHTLRLTIDDVGALVRMGPNAHHRDDRLPEHLAGLTAPVQVDLDVWVTEFGS